MYRQPYYIPKWMRRTIMVLLIASFFIVTPILILYTAGYRYNFETQEFIGTGVLSIDVEPEDVALYVNDNQIFTSLPARLTSLKPGRYDIRIEKPGYDTWQHVVQVESNKTTYIRNISLYQDSLPIRVRSFDTTSTLSLSHQGDYAIFDADRQDTDLTLLNTLTSEETDLSHQSPGSEITISWSPQYPNLSISSIQEEETILQLLSAERPTISATYTHSPATRIQWADEPTPMQYAAIDDSIEQFSLRNQETIVPLLQTDVWYIDSDDLLWVYDQSTSTISSVEETISLPNYYTVTKIIDINDQRIIAQTNAQTLIIRRDADEDEQRIRELPTQEVWFNQYTNEWLTYSPWELWTIYPSGEAVLLTRPAEPIKAVVPLNEAGELLLSTDTSLFAFNPGYYITHHLYEVDSVESIRADIEEKRIIFVGTVAGTRGLYELGY